MPFITALLVAALCAIFGLGPAQAGSILDTPIVGGNMMVAKQGKVEAIYLGSDAAYFSSLYLDDPSKDPDDRFLFNKSTPVGTSLSLGDFSAGTELAFRLDVSNTGKSFFTGDGSINPDRLPHARAITRFDSARNLFVTDVGFEDLYGGGDRDYNDFVFQLTNVIDPPTVPEPATLALLGLGLVGLGAIRRKRIAA